MRLNLEIKWLYFEFFDWKCSIFTEISCSGIAVYVGVQILSEPTPKTSGIDGFTSEHLVLWGVYHAADSDDNAVISLISVLMWLW